MALIFDLLLLALLLAVVFLDAQKGFLRSSVGFARIFLAFAFAFCFSGMLASLLNRLWIFPTVHDAIAQAVVVGGEDSVVAIPITLRAAAAIASVDLQEIVATNATSELVSALAKPIARALSVALAFLILLFASYFALKLFVPMVSRLIRSFSLLKVADTLCGVLFGFFHAFLLGWILAFAGGFLLTLLGASLENTYLIRFFNQTSPIKAIVWLFFR